MIKIVDDFGKEYTFEESELIKRISVYGIYKKEEKLLLIQDRISGCWEFPGGGIDKGETKEQGLIREFFEETGLKIDPENIKFFYKYNGYFYATAYKQPWHSFRNFYFVTVLSGLLLENGNHDDTVAAGYFTKEEIETLKIKPRIKELIDWVFDGKEAGEDL